MTTKVHIILGHNNMPVVIEPYNPSDGTKIQGKTTILRYPGDHFQDYVHNGVSVNVREMTETEVNAEAAKVGPTAT